MSADFVTLSARVSALGERLLTLSDVERMLSASSARDATRVLSDLSWSGAVAEASDPDDFERIIDNGLYEIKSLLLHSSPSRALSEYLFLPFDLHNAKASLAGFAKGKKYEDVRDSLSDLSLFPRRTAFEILTEGQCPTIAGAFFERAIASAQHILQKNSGQIEEGELQLDLSFMEKIADSVSSLDSEALSSFFQLQVDAENIKKLVRRNESGRDQFLAPGKAIPGIAQGVDLERVSSRLSKSSLTPLLEEGKSLSATGKSLLEWELQLDMEVLQTLFWKSLIRPFGPESIVYFFLVKLRNAEIIRSVLVGKRSQFTNEEIREMIQPFFVFLPKK